MGWENESQVEPGKTCQPGILMREAPEQQNVTAILADSRNSGDGLDCNCSRVEAARNGMPGISFGILLQSTESRLPEVPVVSTSSLPDSNCSWAMRAAAEGTSGRG